ncbi:50S ribosomal protein L25/general stress protein Ctc [Salinarimonas soli]|uniref:Large ribosomal subunit protein bL25 n=1 Tax=Salinarimonas soli TaxID=1638099 RepID=A0A5B2VDN6_9HYPH|nr:50S ribosomal protein L25/general stress protein Ctc [Salinarimonas soli]KAA2237191.1 50S ribosomal protein L25/general stress protein Ctc [Salinarimonas soli]
MSDVKQLKAVARDRVGKGAARAVRRQGQVPAVIYGGGQPPQAIALDFNQMKQLIYAGHFRTTIFEIDVDGASVRAIPRDYQLDPVKDFPIHVDFMRIAAGSTVTVEVAVHVVGQERSPGMKRGGALNLVRHTVELTVPADAIPDYIEADVSSMDINDSLHISAVNLPAGAKPTITDRDFTILSITAAAGMRDTAGETAEPAPAA